MSNAFVIYHVSEYVIKLDNTKLLYHLNHANSHITVRVIVDGMYLHVYLSSSYDVGITPSRFFICQMLISVADPGFEDTGGPLF